MFLGYKLLILVHMVASSEAIVLFPDTLGCEAYGGRRAVWLNPKEEDREELEGVEALHGCWGMSSDGDSFIVNWPYPRARRVYPSNVFTTRAKSVGT
jgi:hypothetical protein